MEQPRLTKGEKQVMNVLWSLPKGGCVNDILDRYPEPRPAYTTISTFLKILVEKGFVEYKKGQGKLHIYYPLMTRERYRRLVMDDVKDTFFDGSVKSLLSFFVREEQLSEAEIRELIALYVEHPSTETVPCL